MNKEKLIAIIEKAKAEGDSATYLEATDILNRMGGQEGGAIIEGQEMPDFSQLGKAPQKQEQIVRQSSAGGGSGVALPALQGLSFNMGDEGLAGVLAAYATFMPEAAGGAPDDITLEENYRGIRDTIRGSTEEYAEENPKTALGAEIAGGLLTGGMGLAKAGTGAVKREAAKRGYRPDMDTVKRWAKNAGIGAIGGAAYGLGTAEEMEDVPREMQRGAASGVVGGVAGGEAIHQGRKFFEKRSQFKDMITRKLEEGAPDKATALYRLKGQQKPTYEMNQQTGQMAEVPRQAPISGQAPRLPAPNGQQNLPAPQNNLPVPYNANNLPVPSGADADFGAAPSQSTSSSTASSPSRFLSRILEDVKRGGKKFEDDPIAVEARAAGMDMGSINAFKSANATERGMFHDMTKLAEGIVKDRLKQYDKRPSWVVGDAFANPFNLVLEANKKVGKDLDKAIDGIKGQFVDIRPAVADFQRSLLDDGVKLKRNEAGQIYADYTESTFALADKAQDVLNELIKQMNKGNGMDAFRAHIMKKFIDEEVTWGKSGEGMKGKAERIVKDFRNGIDNILDNNFSDYNDANTMYGRTISAIDEVQDSMGSKIDFRSKRWRDALGQKLRSFSSNQGGRFPLMNSVEEVENIAEEMYGKQPYKLHRIILWNEELESMLPTVARMSLAGEMEKAIKKGSKGWDGLKDKIADEVSEKSASLLEKLDTSDEEETIRILYKLIREG